tara:strand:+ start:379 stop:1116 length:738 start_codon:yes stop_codon:yes gene_type:complete
MVKPNRFYTYAYLREDRTPYYIGKGSGNRAYKRTKKCIKPPKDKSRIIFLKQNLTEEEAFKHEKYMIDVFGRKDLGTGILYNKSDGGDGVSGISEETKIKMSDIKKGENNIFYGCNVEIVRLGRLKGTMKSKETRSREFVVKNLEGDIITGKNVTEFCKKSGYSAGNFLNMLYGNQIMAYGYLLPETKITCYELLAPSGQKYIITNFHKYPKFCKEHNLSYYSFVSMLKGKFSHKGWKLVDTFYR